MELDEVMDALNALADPGSLEGMARYGIATEGALGVRLPDIRKIARKIKKDQGLSLRLWDTGVHEARMLATMVGDPKQVTEGQMERWVGDLDSWDICDQCCGNLFDRTPLAYDKAVEWSGREEEFVKRAGFAMMATLAVHDKGAADERFEAFLPIIVREARDDRNYVRKAVNWALRQIGKRNLALNPKAVEAAEEIGALDSKAARWIASDALRELKGEKVRKRLEEKASR